MLKLTRKYTDYNGVEREEDFHFNLTKAEILDMEVSIPGGMSGLIERLTKSQDTQATIEIFKTIIKKAYGVKSEDGRRFRKTPELLQEFMETEAYSDLYYELLADPQKAADFIKQIIPQQA